MIACTDCHSYIPSNDSCFALKPSVPAPEQRSPGAPCGPQGFLFSPRVIPLHELKGKQ